MRIAVFGANGLTGRLLTEQALAAGHEVAAVTRRPAGFPITRTPERRGGRRARRASRQPGS